MTPILELSHVTKSYQSTRAVDDVSFAMPKGAIFGLLGPNGAGKTSIIRIVTGITRADGGEVRLDGEPLHGNHPETIGYMPEERGLYKKMKVGEHLIYLARLKGLSAADARHEIDRWLGAMPAPRRTFLVHGEPPAARGMRDFLAARRGWAGHVPALGAPVALDD